MICVKSALISAVFNHLLCLLLFSLNNPNTSDRHKEVEVFPVLKPLQIYLGIFPKWLYFPCCFSLFNVFNCKYYKDVEIMFKIGGGKNQFFFFPSTNNIPCHPE